MDETDELSREETESEDEFFTAEPVPELTGAPFAALQPHVKINSADKLIKHNFLNFINVPL
ncbi:hypothetical protein A7X67_02040 [Clostridium sp. W14A]|nr:hypothetical protein A7X67_02040 [Clostridium sp. W14A]